MSGIFTYIYIGKYGKTAKIMYFDVLSPLKLSDFAENLHTEYFDSVVNSFLMLF